MRETATDVVIIGAGPYGLSIAAHLRELEIRFRIFGTPMQSWRQRMPAGMFLKSEGFASDLFDPKSSFTLAHHCKERGLPYQAIGHPVPLETFIDYGIEFQKRLVPNLEETDITLLQEAPNGFALQTAAGEKVLARRVVVAVGITHFGYVPEPLSNLGSQHVTHSSEHRDMGVFRGRSVVVVGAGASAVDVAALMHEAGADVQLLARRAAIDFHSPPVEPRPWLQQVRNPRSGLGLGWRSRLCTDAPLLFHLLPYSMRRRAVRSHLGPAPGWFVKDKVVGHVPIHLGAQLRQAVIRDQRVHLTCNRSDGSEFTLAADHVVAGTGFNVALERLRFLDPSLRQRLRSLEDAPILDRNFQSSIPGLYMVGVASAYSFGPLTRFAYGAGFTARRLSRRLHKDRRVNA